MPRPPGAEAFRLAECRRPAAQCVTRNDPSQTRSQTMNTRTIAILALVIAAVVLLFLLL